MVCHYICCLNVCWVPRVDQSCGIYSCQKLICRECGGQPSDYLEGEGNSLLFSSILKQLQSKVSQHVGDTSRGAVFSHICIKTKEI